TTLFRSVRSGRAAAPGGAGRRGRGHEHARCAGREAIPQADHPLDRGVAGAGPPLHALERVGESALRLKETPRMATTATLSAALRQEHGKGPARRLRREGKVPAVIYGHGEATRSLTVDAHELERLFSRIQV